MMNEPKYLYILTNASFRDHCVKWVINDLPPHSFSVELFNRDVPMPYEVYATARSVKCRQLVNFLNNSFQTDKSQDRGSHGFFMKAPEEILKSIEAVKVLIDDIVLERFHGEAMPSIDPIDRPTSQRSTEFPKQSVTPNHWSHPAVTDTPPLNSKGTIKPKFRFSMVGIQPGDYVTFVDDDIQINVKVVDDRHVEYGGRIYSLSGLCYKLKRNANPTSSYPGPEYFQYKGIKLSDLRKLNEGLSVNEGSLKFKFSMIGIRSGDYVTYDESEISVKSDGMQLRVVDDKHIEFEGHPYSLSQFCSEFDPQNRPSKSYNGQKYFSYRGYKLQDLRCLKEAGRPLPWDTDLEQQHASVDSGEQFRALSAILSELDPPELSKTELHYSKNKKRVSAPPFNFSMVEIPAGEELTFDPTGIKVRVADVKNIEYRGRLYTLSGFCTQFMPNRKRSGRYQGPLFFSYRGRTLNDWRKLKESGRRLPWSKDSVSID